MACFVHTQSLTSMSDSCEFRLTHPVSVEDELQPIARLAKSLKILTALKFAFGAPSLLSSMTKLQGSSTLNVGSSSNALGAPPTALRATMAFESPRALRGCMVFQINSL